MRALGLLASGVLVLTGCGGKDAAADPPASSGSSTSDSSSTAPSPSVEPASGDLMDTTVVSANAPEGWNVKTLVKDQTVSALTKDAGSLVGLSVIDDYGTDYSLAQLARRDLRTGSYTHGKVLPDEVMAGLPVFHVRGMADILTHYDAYGLEHNGYAVTVIFKLLMNATKRQQVIDSVLATVELK